MLYSYKEYLGGKMAGKMKKGFATYLLILFIALVASFMIWVTIMLFSPFKSYLGIQYFAYQTETYAYNETGAADDEKLDFSTLKEIKINCDYANVTVERYLNVDNHAIKFTNKTQGFANDAQDVSFFYEISFEDDAKNILNVDVHEPEGFLYLNKNLTISILVPADAEYALQNTKIDITNASGSINIGNRGELVTTGSNIIDINSLSIKTNSGKITLFPYVDKNFNDIFIKSNGKVEIKNDIVVSNNLEIYSDGGDLDFGAIDFQNSSAEAVLDLGNAKISATIIKGNINLAIKSGYVEFDKVEGNISSNNANAQMEAANIDIKEVTGVVSLPFANNSLIFIDTMKEGSEFYAKTTSGSIKINKAYGMVYAEATSGNVEVYTFFNDIQVKTKSGKINVTFDNSTIANELSFFTETGKINLNVKSNLAFVLAVYKPEGGLKEGNVFVEGVDNVTNPLTINGGTNKIVVYSNGEVNINLLDIA